MSRRERTEKIALQKPKTKEPTAVEHLHIKIPLKPQTQPAAFPPHFTDALREEYAIQYLQRLGAQATSANITMVLKNLPLEECQVATAWKARGSLNDVVVIDLYPQPRRNLRAKLEDDKQHSSRTIPATTGGGTFNQLQATKRYQIGSVCWTFDEMKRKYLLPFKAGIQNEPDVLSLYGMKHDKPFNYLHASTLALTCPTNPGRHGSFQAVKCANERIVPPDPKPEFIRQMIRAFYDVLPFSTLGIRKESEKEQLLHFLLDSSMLELIAKMIQYLYLEVFFKIGCVGPVALVKPISTSPQKIEILYVTLMRLYTSIKQRMELQDRGISVLLPLHLLALRVCVETTYRYQYPSSFVMSAPTMQLILIKMEDAITRLLDPEQHLSRIGILETTCESSKIKSSHPYQVQKRRTHLRDQFYQTSDTLQTIFPHPIPGKCRKIIKQRGGAAIANYPLPTPQTLVDEDSKPVNQYDGGDERIANIDTRLQLLQIIEQKHQSGTVDTSEQVKTTRPQSSVVSLFNI